MGTIASRAEVAQRVVKILLLLCSLGLRRALLHLAAHGLKHRGQVVALAPLELNHFLDLAQGLLAVNR